MHNNQKSQDNSNISNDILKKGKYRDCVGILLIKNKKIFAGKRSDLTSKYYQMPQGGVDSGELYIDAAKRELFEETGVNKFNVIGEYPDLLYYEFDDHIRSLERFKKHNYIGQQQKWFAFEILQNDNSICTSGNNNAPQEFSEWKWLSKKELLETVVPFKYDVYKKLFDFFDDYII